MLVMFKQESCEGGAEDHLFLNCGPNRRRSGSVLHLRLALSHESTRVASQKTSGVWPAAVALSCSETEMEDPH